MFYFDLFHLLTCLIVFSFYQWVLLGWFLKLGVKAFLICLESLQLLQGLVQRVRLFLALVQLVGNEALYFFQLATLNHLTFLRRGRRQRAKHPAEVGALALWNFVKTFCETKLAATRSQGLLRRHVLTLSVNRSNFCRSWRRQRLVRKLIDVAYGYKFTCGSPEFRAINFKLNILLLQICY